MDEGVHDVHGFFGDTNVGVDLLEDFVDVDREGLDSSSSGFSVGGGFFGFSWFLSHFELFIRLLECLVIFERFYRTKVII